MVQLSKPKARVRTGLWFDRLMALVVLVNVGWVFFDLTYVRWRDLYVRYLPAVTQWYDPMKGIEDHRVTAGYLSKVDKLESLLTPRNPTTQTEGDLDSSAASESSSVPEVMPASLRSPEVQTLLEGLRAQSVEMIEDNPFQLSERLGAFERTKNRIRERMDLESSKEAFQAFWTVDHLQKQGWKEELDFFNSQIRPQFNLNFYRHIDESGQFVEQFWRFDRWFVAVFAIDFLVRTWRISRRYRNVRWRDAFFWRWYDIPLLLPFWRWLRVIPLSVRWSEARFVNVSPLRLQLVRGVSAYLANEMTELVVIRVIDRTQSAIRSGEISSRLVANPERQFIDVDGIDTTSAIVEEALGISLFNVWPQIQPDIEALLAHTIASAYSDSVAYRSLQGVPGLGQIPNRLASQIAHQLSAGLHAMAVGAMEDDEGKELYERLMDSIRRSLSKELGEASSLDRLQERLADLLEEVKLNYVQTMEEEDVETLMQEISDLKDKR